MNIIINNTSMLPIYEQIVGQMKQLILNNTLKQEQMLRMIFVQKSIMLHGHRVQVVSMIHFREQALMMQ